jgi:2-oxo-4-hydroxy-4-carboxy-5-ureidoimidazoline decarboxylase
MILPEWNTLPLEEAIREVAPCCGAKRWALEMASKRPYEEENPLFQTASFVWNSLNEEDWLEAFASHPKIGERAASEGKKHQAWASQEQAGTATVEETIKARLKARNEEYEKKFGFIYIVCATGKSAEEMLNILQTRLNNSREMEIMEAAKQQEQITAIRLRKWLDS